MTAGAVVRARVEESVKDEATAVLVQFGLTVSDVVRMTLTRVAKDKALPFELRIPNEQTVKAMEEADRIAANRKSRFATGDEMLNALEADDVLKGLGRRVR